MGLDMYLFRKTYVKNWDHMGNPWKITVEYKDDPVPDTQIDPGKLAYLVEEVAYWRKANHIHRWFVKNVQDGRDECQYSYVGEENIRELLSVIRRVLHDQDPVKAEELLPCRSGFLFGGMDYDLYYWESLQRTLEMLSPLIEESNQSAGFSGFEYHASW